MVDKKNHLVAKDNNLIEAKYRLSIQEQRLMAIMVSDIHPEDKDFKKYKYKIKDILEWLNIEDGGYYKKLRAITRKLISRCITIYNPEDESIFMTSWLAGAKYYPKKGYVELSFHPDLKPYLLQLKDCFTTYALKNVLELKSKYAFRIYELCKQYQSVNKRKFQIDELREILGIEKNELKRWSDFKKRVLEIAQREINKHTDIKIKYEFEKLGRKIEYITIHIKPQIQREIQDKETNKRYTELLKIVKKEERKKKTIQNAIIKYLKNKGFEYVKRNIEYANEKAQKNYRSFLIQSLKEDWALFWWEEKKEREERERILKDKERKELEEKRKIEAIRSKYWEQAEKEWCKLSDKIKQEVINQVKEKSPFLNNDKIIEYTAIGKIYKKIIEEDFEKNKINKEIYEKIRNLIDK